MHGLARDAKLPWPGQNWLFMAEMQGLDYVVGCPINHFLLPNWSREKVLTKTKSTKGICISSAMCVWQCVLIVIGAILSTLCRRDRAAWASSCVTLRNIWSGQHHTAITITQVTRTSSTLQCQIWLYISCVFTSNGQQKLTWGSNSQFNENHENLKYTQ